MHNTFKRRGQRAVFPGQRPMWSDNLLGDLMKNTSPAPSTWAHCIRQDRLTSVSPDQVIPVRWSLGSVYGVSYA